MKFFNNDTLSFCKINRINHYQDFYYIIEGEFKLQVYSSEYEYPKLLENGSFKLVVAIPEDGFDYSIFDSYYW
ncbi:MAG TPA: hypothetical protein DCQ26_06370 [Marinilabiliales bacterium]|jgi:hypothetical protein|nr:MAG: hypothetical protein A2W95_03980 [Bacteroidetes bacterium GWA2_40_14]OFX58516.1 MAG: hypothetical protein A2W84_08785 [Bacteroidetes bacterium GWC2_40_13]OFX74138.1 MAG: hypothetical protein A2W96_12595 [Bacteroidetes bacterium GWD2_40_43]OFY21398.1 MAG: hypothetical protein A2W88_09480 [Bacteroidetes bacterium GWF2_40_13]OFZ27392.1 MAG: hypothetical protein A2437_13955 [Bacteroidetes bacterium RIFOXYC2_FULL_40_12]HAM98218.1 hypothetical protein [Marinilabiliales bacterium]